MFRFLAIANRSSLHTAQRRAKCSAPATFGGPAVGIVQGQDIGQAYSFVHTGNAKIGFVAYSPLKKTAGAIEGSYWLVPSVHQANRAAAMLLRECRPRAHPSSS